VPLGVALPFLPLLRLVVVVLPVLVGVSIPSALSDFNEPVNFLNGFLRNDIFAMVFWENNLIAGKAVLKVAAESYFFLEARG
jgi:hypothetical protein